LARTNFAQWTASLAALLLIGVSLPAGGQALPAAEASPISTGFSLPTTSGSLTYGISASESLNWGFYSNSQYSAGTNVSGDLGYISNSKRDPFSAVLAGGHSFGTLGQPSYDFVSLGLSQVIAIRRWDFLLSDSTSYLPQTPTNGFAGIPGLGDLGVSAISLGIIPTSVLAPPSQGILTNYANRVDNSVSGSFQRDFTAKTGLHGSASYSISRYTQNTGNPLTDGLDSNGISGGGGINHMYNQRNVLGGNFTYSDYHFLPVKNLIAAPDFKTQTASANYLHQFTRRFQVSAAAGPQWTTVDLGTITTSLDVFANLSAIYQGEYTKSSLSYVRTTTSGYGVIGGALSNSVGYAGSKVISRVWAASVNASYAQSTSLPSPYLPSYTFRTAVIGAQVSHALPHSLSAYASYTLQNQSNHGAFLTVLNAFSGHYQTLGFGITYAPPAIHFGGR
jgi:hypothetical protein